MPTTLRHALRAEWIKRRRSLLWPLILGAAFFTPTIILAARLRRLDQMGAIYRAPDFWERLWTMTWESIVILILPTVIMLLTSLIVQIEFRNNAWKQVHASPQTLATVFTAKLLVILAVVAQLMALFCVAIFVTASLPALLLADVPFPGGSIPYALFGERLLRFYIDSLPIVGLQYALSLRFRNFIVPLGIGMAIWILAVGLFNTSINYLIPYAYPLMDYMVDARYKAYPDLPASVPAMAFGSFVAFCLVGFGLYARDSDRG